MIRNSKCQTRNNSAILALIIDQNMRAIIYSVFSFGIRNDHTTMTAPLPVCSAKLSIVGPG